MEGENEWTAKVVSENEPVIPTEPVVPVIPTTPAEPAEPQNPTEPIDPIEPIVPTEPTDPAQPREVEYEDAKVLDFIKAKLGVDVNSFDDLKPKEQKKLTPEIEKFLQFQEETGNTSYNDFVQTQKDWTKEDKSAVLKAYMKSQNPMLEDAEINFIFKKKYGFDEDMDEDDVILEKKITEKQDYHKALELLEQQKEKYKVPSGSEELIPKPYKEAKEFVDKMQQQQQLNQQVRQSFEQETESLFSNNFEGFELNVDGKQFKIKPENIELTKKQQLDIANFEKKHFDEKGKLINAKEYHLALFAASDPVKFAKHFIEIGKAEFAEEDEVRSKNLDMGKQKVPDNASGQSQWQVRKVN
jgi:hypothetical protein